MEHDLSEVFGDSFQRCTANPKFLDYFYDLFVVENQKVAQKFASSDRATQKLMLRKSIAYVMFAKKSPKLIRVTALKHSKSNLDVRPELYSLWLDAIIEAAKLTDCGFNEITEQAWRAAMQPGIEYMAKVYNESYNPRHSHDGSEENCSQQSDQARANKPQS